MNRKLLDGSCVVFGAALFVKLAIYFSPWHIRVPSDFLPLVNAIMLVSYGLALSLAAYLLFKSGIIRRKRLILSVASALVFASACVALYVHEQSVTRHQADIFDHLSSKDVEIESQPVK